MREILVTYAGRHDVASMEWDWLPNSILPTFNLNMIACGCSYTFLPQTVHFLLGLDLVAHCVVLLELPQQNQLGRCRSICSEKRSIFLGSQPSFLPSLLFQALFHSQMVGSCLHRRKQLKGTNKNGFGGFYKDSKMEKFKLV